MHSAWQNVKRPLKGARKRLRRAYARWRYRFTPDDLLALLSRLGIVPGDVVMAHSSFNRFEGFTGGVTDAIDVLQRAVGESGTLLMPTMPFSGLAVDRAASGEVFDIRRSPSHMGIITEVFRRMPDVRRSLHPTHPVAAWGQRAEAMITDHPLRLRDPLGATIGDAG